MKKFAHIIEVTENQHDYLFWLAPYLKKIVSQDGKFLGVIYGSDIPIHLSCYKWSFTRNKAMITIMRMFLKEYVKDRPLLKPESIRELFDRLSGEM